MPKPNSVCRYMAYHYVSRGAYEMNQARTELNYTLNPLQSGLTPKEKRYLQQIANEQQALERRLQKMTIRLRESSSFPKEA